jgi:hypothetical protein
MSILKRLAKRKGLIAVAALGIAGSGGAGYAVLNDVITVVQVIQAIDSRFAAGDLKPEDYVPPPE